MNEYEEKLLATEVASTSGLNKAATQFEIGNIELRRIDYSRLHLLFVESPRFRELFIKRINSNYPLPDILIERHKNLWDWRMLSTNESLPWCEDLLNLFVDRWNWFELSGSRVLPWSDKLIERFVEYWDWEGLSENEELCNISENLIERYADMWNWDALIKNEKIPWNRDFTERHASRWEGVFPETNTENLYSTAHYVYTQNWDLLADSSSFAFMLLSFDEDIPWSEMLIDQFQDRWSWDSLSDNESLPWSEVLIERYSDRWSWHSLSGNRSLPWSESLIERYIDRWSWGCLSGNESLRWSESLIERYSDRWSWRSLSGNESLPWSVEFIERYVEQWDWWRFLDNKSLPWNVSFILQYSERLFASEPRYRLNYHYHTGIGQFFMSWDTQAVNDALESIQNTISSQATELGR